MKIEALLKRFRKTLLLKRGSLYSSETVNYHCEDGCKERGLGEKRTTLKSVRDSKFIILILKRAVTSDQGYHLVKSTEPIEIR